MIRLEYRREVGRPPGNDGRIFGVGKAIVLPIGLKPRTGFAREVRPGIRGTAEFRNVEGHGGRRDLGCPVFRRIL